MNETKWRHQWLGAQKTIVQWAKSASESFEKNGTQSIVVSYLVDAVHLPHLDTLANAYQHVYVITEHDICNSWTNVSIHKLPTDFYGAYYIKDAETDGEIIREFNCFMNRIDPIRQSWFYLLYYRGWLDKSMVSFNMHQRSNLWYPSDSVTDTFNYYHEKTLSSFDFLKDEIQKIIPFKNFVDDDNLCEIILCTKFSLVVESYFERTDCRVLSEKIWRAIQVPRPWLLFAATGCVQKIRDMGIDVFDDYVDHDSYDFYDTSENCVERQEAILREATRLMHLKVTQNTIADWKKRTLNNRKIIRSWYENWTSKCRETFDYINLLAISDD
jgi:hypothetical protein